MWQALGLGVLGGLASAGASSLGGAGYDYRRIKPRSKEENLMLRQLLQGMAAGEAGIYRGIGEEQIIHPELYRTLGYEPTFEQQPGLQKAVAQLKERQGELQQRVTRLRGMGKKEIQRRINEGTLEQGELKKTQQQLDFLNAGIARMEATPGKLTGLTALAGGTGMGTLTDLMQGRLGAALKGETEDDPRLVRQMDDQERILRERMRQQLGSGWESSTAGIQALREFEAFKRETLTASREAKIRQYTGLLPTMAATTGAQMANLVYPSQMTTLGGQQAQQAARGYLEPLEYMQRERLAELHAPIAPANVSAGKRFGSTALAGLGSSLSMTGFSSLMGGGGGESSSGSEYGSYEPVYYEQGPLAGKEVPY